MDLKRAMLLRLARKNTELYPSDPVKREKVYNKYKVVGLCSLSDTTFVGNGEISALTNLGIYQLLYKRSSAVTLKEITCFFSRFLLSEQQFEIPEEEAEWLGLSLEEAVEKQRQLEHKVPVSSNTTRQAVSPHI